MSNGEIITKEEGKAMIDKYQNAFPNSKKAYLYDAELIQSLLNQDGVVTVRIYNGMKTNGDTCVVIVGVDANDTDMTDGIVLEKGNPCPPKCVNGGYFS